MAKYTPSSSSSAGGVGLVGALTILFIALKLTEVISWPWWLVLFPLWIGAVVVAVAFALILAVIFVKGS